MAIKPKVHRAYRLKQDTADTIEAIARARGLRSQAEVIDGWAEEWALVNGAPMGSGQVSESEKKSGGARKVLPVVPGVFPASKLSDKKPVLEMDERGRIDRKPITKPNGRI